MQLMKVSVSKFSLTRFSLRKVNPCISYKKDLLLSCTSIINATSSGLSGPLFENKLQESLPFKFSII